MLPKKTFIITSGFILLITAVIFIIVYFIYFKEVENVLEISKIFPYNTAFFWGIDNIQPRADRIAKSQTKAELKKLGIDEYLQDLERIMDKEIFSLTGLHVKDWIKFVSEDAGFVIDYKHKQIVFIGAVRFSKKSKEFNDVLTNKVFNLKGSLWQIKKYDDMEYNLSDKGYIVCLYDNILIVSNDKDYFIELCDVLLKRSKSLAHNDLFVQTQMKLRYVGGYFSYINVNKVINKSELITFLFKKIFPLFGYDILKFLTTSMVNYLVSPDEVKAIGLSGDIIGEEIIQKAYIALANKNKTNLLLYFLSMKPFKLDIDKIISGKCIDFVIFYVEDMGKLYDKLEEQIQNINNAKMQLVFFLVPKFLESEGIDIKRDIVDLIGNQIVLYDYKIERKDRMGYLLSAEIKDMQIFKDTLVKFEKIYSNYSVKMQIEDYYDYKIYCNEVALRGDMNLCYAAGKGHLFIADDDQILKESIDIEMKKADSITKDIKYKNCKAKADKKSNFLLYSKGSIASLIIGEGSNQFKEAYEQRRIAEGMKILRESIEKSCGEISVGVSGDDGFVIKTFFPLSYIYALEVLFVKNLLTK